MNIVSVCIHYPSPEHPTRGIFVERRLQAMAKLADVRVISPRPWFPFVRPYREQDSLELGELPVYRPRMPYLPGVAKGWDGYWLKRSLLPKLRSLSAKTRIDVIDAHFEYPEGVGAIMAANTLGIPTVVTIRGLLTKYLKLPSHQTQILSSLKQATAVIAVSESLKDLAVEHGVRSEQIFVVPNGIDSQVFQPSVGNSPSKEELIVSVGHIAPVKGYHILLKAFASLKRNRPTLRLCIIGRINQESAYSRKIIQLIKEHGIADSVSLAGECKPDSVAAWLRQAKVFCLPSYHEGCCNAVLEALACGVPVVTTPVGDNAKYIIEGRNGFLVPVRNVAALSTALSTALDLSWDGNAISAGMTRSWGTVASEVMEVMNRLVPSHDRSAINTMSQKYLASH